MSTRSRIAAVFPDGTFKSIYCHYDGYPAGVGRRLLGMSQEDARTLVAGPPRSEFDRPMEGDDAEAMRQHDSKNLDALMQDFFNSDQDFLYYMVDGVWWMLMRDRSYKPRKLTKRLTLA